MTIEIVLGGEGRGGDALDPFVNATISCNLASNY